MALYSPKDERYHLPTVINPPDSVCYVIHVPNDLYHIQAFLGALFDLAQWINWERDGTRNATLTAQVWKKIWLELEPQHCDQITTLKQIGSDTGVEQMIRQNPDNPCILETSIDGTNWCQFADLSLCMNFGTQPGSGSPQPPPNGGSQQYCSQLQANGQMLIPTTVNTGDQITINSASGAGSDGNPLRWNCPDGSFFFAGACAGGGGTDSGDPVPTALHMSLILGIGSTFYAMTIGTPFYVPSGVTNGQPYIQVNDSTLADNQGSYNVCVTAKNNQAGTWSHTFDFTMSDGGWSALNAGSGDLAIWAPGTGWKNVYGVLCGNCSDDDIEIVFGASTINRVEVFYSATLDFGSGGARGVYYKTTGAAVLYGALNTGAGTFDTPIDNVQAGVTALQIHVGRDVTGDEGAVISKCIINGSGVNPFA